MSSNTRKYGSSARQVMQSSSAQALGEYGKEILGEGNLISTEGVIFRQLFALSDCTIVAIQDDDAGSGIDILAGANIPVGAIIFGHFHDIEISSGILICYKEGTSANMFDPMLPHNLEG